MQNTNIKPLTYTKVSNKTSVLSRFLSESQRLMRFQTANKQSALHVQRQLPKAARSHNMLEEGIRQIAPFAFKIFFPRTLFHKLQRMPLKPLLTCHTAKIIRLTIVSDLELCRLVVKNSTANRIPWHYFALTSC
jgi:hypothetical protein